MDTPEIVTKFVVLEVDGEAAAVFPVPSLADGARHEMLAAVLASNPVVRLVDRVEAGQRWDGTKYA